MKELLRIEDLHVVYLTHRGKVHAINGANLLLNRGEFLGLVGETGCGKSTLGLSIVKLLDQSARIEKGSILFNGKSVLDLNDNEIREFRRREVSMIFQDPTAALNPVYKIGEQITEVFINSKGMNKKEALQESENLLRYLGVPSPHNVLRMYPHELSGGMRQRAMIAIALAKDPLLLIADEPTSNLDVTIQAQILELMARLKERINMSMLLITHDVGIVAQVCDKIAIMYAGQVIEFGDVKCVFKEPTHPYTQGLLKVANFAGEKGKLETIPGSIPNLINPPKGCLFSPRCPYAFNRCFRERPTLLKTKIDSLASCWLVEEGA
ncbi:MAG: ABC transporter ATP-binding protein [Candidatus Bathyarchaeia archaeon]